MLAFDRVSFSHCSTCPEKKCFKNATVVPKRFPSRCSASVSKHVAQKSNPFKNKLNATKCRGSKRRTGSRTFCSADYTPFPFKEDDYRRVNLNVIVQTSVSDTPGGTLILMEENTDVQLIEEAKALLLQVGGDTLIGLSYAASGREPVRPMTLNLLMQFLEHCKQVSDKEWHLLQVAIVDMKDNTFIGRLFFGNAENGEVAWDCDCRPSDGCWLALKTMCPLYVHVNVWEECAQPVKSLFSVDQARSLLEGLGQFSSGQQQQEQESDPMTAIMSNDPGVIKLLKREMAVAISEEDYATAARLRDHPYMQKYKTIQEHKKAGRYNEAATLENELNQEVQDNDNSL